MPEAGDVRGAASGLRIIFMGTSPLSRACLQAILEQPGLRVAAVVTQPDRAKGRSLSVQPSPAKELAILRNLPVLQPEKARDEHFIAGLEKLAPDLILVAAYGHILPPAILQLPRFGCLNVHMSLLPKYRGAAPIQWALLNGDAVTGVTIMKMDAGMDTGDILAQTSTPILPADDAQTLHDRLACLGAELLVGTIPEYVAGRIQPRPQPADGVSHAPKIKKEDGRIDWSQSARAIGNRVRAFTPWPGAFTFFSAEPRKLLLKLWKVEVAEGSGDPGTVVASGKRGVLVACGQAALRILELQIEGGRRMSAQEFLAGHSFQPGQRLG